MSTSYCGTAQLAEQEDETPLTHTRWSPYSLGDGTLVIMTPSSLISLPPPGPPKSLNWSAPEDRVRRNDPSGSRDPRLPGLLPGVNTGGGGGMDPTVSTRT